MSGQGSYQLIHNPLADFNGGVSSDEEEQPTEGWPADEVSVLCMLIYVCVRACVYVYVCVCMHMCVYVCMCACVCVCIDVCMCVCVHVCMLSVRLLFHFKMCTSCSIQQTACGVCVSLVWAICMSERI